MIIIRVIGGLGNQLYQYALYEKMKSLGKNVKLDITDYMSYALQPEKRSLELEYFDGLHYDVCTLKERFRFTDDSPALLARARRRLFGTRRNVYVESRDYEPEIFGMEHIYLDGFWNCEKYYEDRISFLQQKIVFPKSPEPKNRETAAKMLLENSVAVHIRRSDYLDACRAGRYANICTKAYYKASAEYVRERVENPHFYIFSDDVPYARRKFSGKNTTIVDWNAGSDSIFDMMLMTKCRACICANSTFSMWGARLNSRPDKIMVRPLKHDNTQDFTAAYMKEMWKGWVLADPEGGISDG